MNSYPIVLENEIKVHSLNLLMVSNLILVGTIICFLIGCIVYLLNMEKTVSNMELRPFSFNLK